MKGEAASSFKSNRIGICVHHPIATCAGRTVSINRPDKSHYDASFPVTVGPHQPFKEIHEMQWSIEKGTEAKLTFAGEVFETEDQRNWTDASYKTYSRPLELPFPYGVDAGDRIEQKVTLEVIKESASVDAAVPISKVPVAKVPVESKVPFPRIGYNRATGCGHLTGEETALLKKLPFNHYRVELQMEKQGWLEEFYDALLEAKEIGTKLELIVFFTKDIRNEIKVLLEILQHHEKHVVSLLMLQEKYNVTPVQLLQQFFKQLKTSFPTLLVGYGTNGFFADSNRNRPETEFYDFVSFSLSPQVHATDTRSIIENLDAQPDVIQTAKTFIGNKAIHISPVTFKMRSSQGEGIDKRLDTSFAAFWTLQAIKNLSGATSITFYETVGAKGLIKRNRDMERLSGTLPNPIFTVLAALKEFQVAWIIIKNDNDKSGDTIIFENKNGDRLSFICSGFGGIKDSK
jgi:hypothetical protein